MRLNKERLYDLERYPERMYNYAFLGSLNGYDYSTIKNRIVYYNGKEFYFFAIKDHEGYDAATEKVNRLKILL
jgi:hypothetical protein